MAAEFLDNPFCEPFRQEESKIAEQQAMEVGLVKSALHNLPAFERILPEEVEALEEIAEKLLAKDKAARDASAAAVVPVKRTLGIEAAP